IQEKPDRDAIRIDMHLDQGSIGYTENRNENNTHGYLSAGGRGLRARSDEEENSYDPGTPGGDYSEGRGAERRWHQLPLYRQAGQEVGVCENAFRHYQERLLGDGRCRGPRAGCRVDSGDRQGRYGSIRAPRA